MNFLKILNFCPLFDQILGIFWSFLVSTPCRYCKLCCFVKRIFLFNVNYCIFTNLISKYFTQQHLGLKILTFCKSALILAIKLAMRKPPFKRNPYLRDKFGLADFSLKSRFHCTFKVESRKCFCRHLQAVQ